MTILYPSVLRGAKSSVSVCRASLRSLSSICISVSSKVTRIVSEHNEHFSSFEAFVKHAIEMNLVWWGKNPNNILQMMGRTVVTKEQKQFTIDFQAGKYADKTQQYTGISEEHNKFLKKAEQAIKETDTKIAIDDKEAVKYDGYPLLFRFYSRFLPAKLSLIVLANMISKEKPYVELEEFQNESYEIISEFNSIQDIYIADGHHRSSSSSILCKNILSPFV